MAAKRGKHPLALDVLLDAGRRHEYVWGKRKPKFSVGQRVVACEGGALERRFVIRSVFWDERWKTYHIGSSGQFCYAEDLVRPLTKREKEI